MNKRKQNTSAFSRNRNCQIESNSWSVFRSGSDPSLAMNASEPSRTEPLVRFFRSQDENRKPSTESMPGTGSRTSRWGGSSHRTPDSSPKSSKNLVIYFYRHSKNLLSASYSHLKMSLRSSYDHFKIILQSPNNHLMFILQLPYDHPMITLWSSYNDLMIILHSPNV